MSDRLSLAHTIEDAGIERAKAEAVATAIARFVEGSSATKADVQASEAALKVEITAVRAEVARAESALKLDLAGLRAETHDGFARHDVTLSRQDVAIERVRSEAREMESRIIVRLGAIVAAGVAIIVALQHLWR